MVGKTETGQPYYVGEADRLMLVDRGSATMNGVDLGEVSSPTWPLEFGDGVPYVRPVLKLGTLYIPYEDEMLEGNAKSFARGDQGDNKSPSLMYMNRLLVFLVKERTSVLRLKVVEWMINQALFGI
jgi:hypothetical protein